MKKRDFKRGFTMVEVALVLAIAGLIFLMVFVALPAIQKTQRDAERRDDIGTLLTAIQKYQNNNRGGWPTGVDLDVVWNDSWNEGKPMDGTWENFYYSFLGDNFSDPRGDHYTIAVRVCGAKAGMECDGEVNKVEETEFLDNNYTIYLVEKAMCDGSKAVGSSNPKRAAAVYKMEGAGAYCANTQ